MGHMPRPPRLSPDDVSAALARLPAWSGDADGIERTVRLSSFREAVDTVVAIADVAEEMDHHPDIDLRWRTLRIAVATHSAGGVTALDLDLAQRVDALLPG
jgi:4a-hydroxytetrahydrobiopterin dehydratase